MTFFLKESVHLPSGFIWKKRVCSLLFIHAALWISGLTRDAHASETINYFYVDLAGSTLARTDASGSIVSLNDYKPYGKTVLGSQTQGVGYAGNVSDVDIGLIYMGSRYYDPDVARFISADPVAGAAGNLEAVNRYEYASDDPLDKVDRDGRLPEYLSGQSWRRDGLMQSSLGYDPDVCHTCLAKGSDKDKGKSKADGALTYAQITDIVAKNNKSGESDEIVIATIWKESAFKPAAKSTSSSAVGLMQITKAAARDVGARYSTLKDPAKNVAAGSAYLGKVINRYNGGDVRAGLNAYGTGTPYANNIIRAASELRDHPENSAEILARIHD